MGLVSIIVTLLIVGFIVFLINSAPFINQWFKNAIYGVICLAVLIWLLRVLGLLSGVNLHL